ncbi:MAG TPA: ankyrin repeat domain-containing protein [Noviherbaspirillum sp.]|nr:ankyrin repeat domain-containing protein [Noviherbaspirillum sp.]
MTAAIRTRIVPLLGVVTCALAVLYGSIAFSMTKQSPVLLLACMETEVPWRAWTCEQVLRHVTLSEEQVFVLNRQAGARLPAALARPKLAERMLKAFLAHGVDINARDVETRGWTALHGFVAGRSPDKVALLLKYGASVKVADEDGMTPIDLARRLSKDYPGDASIAVIVSLLGTGTD